MYLIHLGKMTKKGSQMDKLEIHFQVLKIIWVLPLMTLKKKNHCTSLNCNAINSKRSYRSYRLYWPDPIKFNSNFSNKKELLGNHFLLKPLISDKQDCFGDCFVWLYGFSCHWLIKNPQPSSLLTDSSC